MLVTKFIFFKIKFNDYTRLNPTWVDKAKQLKMGNNVVGFFKTLNIQRHMRMYQKELSSFGKSRKTNI